MINTIASILREYMLMYLSLDKYLCIFSRQMEAIVYVTYTMFLTKFWILSVPSQSHLPKKKINYYLNFLILDVVSAMLHKRNTIPVL